MKNQDFFKLFVDELADMYSAENQIIEALPNLIKLATSQDLKEALTKHLKETEFQAERIEKIFAILDIAPKDEPCKGMEGILKEGDHMVKNKTKSPVLDATIISAAQKVEHYEIASYGTLKEFAKQMSLGSEVINLLQDSLDEEGGANKKLTKIAEGSFFTAGINEEALAKGSNGKRK